MKLRTLMLFTAILTFVFGLGFLVVPVQSLSLYGVTTDAVGLIFTRFFGSAMLGYAILTWFAKEVDDPLARRAIVLALFLSSLLGAVVAIWGQAAGLFNSFGMIGVVLFPLFAIGYGYYQFIKPVGMRSPG